MSNERIDLTQFEGMTKGPWFIDVEDKPMRLRKVWTDEDDAKFSIPDYDLDKFDVAVVEHTKADVAVVEHTNADAGFTISEPDFRGIEMVPELIAELKRCYERIDSLEERIEWMEHVSSGIHEEDWANQVREWLECAHPSKWCSWGDCPKCASE